MSEQHLCIKHEGSEFWNATIWFPVREGHVYGYFIDATNTHFIWEVKDGVKRISEGLIQEWHLQDGKFIESGNDADQAEMDPELFSEVEEAVTNLIDQYLWFDAEEESFEIYSPYFYENGIEMTAVNFKPTECEELFRYSDRFVICDEEIDELHDDLNEMFSWVMGV